MFNYYGYILEIKLDSKWQIAVIFGKIYIMDKIPSISALP